MLINNGLIIKFLYQGIRWHIKQVQKSTNATLLSVHCSYMLFFGLNATGMFYGL